MKYFSVALITVAAFAGDFLAYWADLDKDQQRGWSYTSTFCLLFAAWFFWRGRPGGPAEDEERRGGEQDEQQRERDQLVNELLAERRQPKEKSAFDRAIDDVLAQQVRKLYPDEPGPAPGA